MPTYEYVCKRCGEHVEVVQSFKDDALTTCANCGGELRKVFGSIGITFKGSGFYRTDNRSSGSRDGSKPAAASSSSDSSGSKASGSGSDSKSSGSDSKSSGSKSSGSGSSGSSRAEAG